MGFLMGAFPERPITQVEKRKLSLLWSTMFHEYISETYSTGGKKTIITPNTIQ